MTAINVTRFVALRILKFIASKHWFMKDVLDLHNENLIDPILLYMQTLLLWYDNWIALEKYHSISMIQSLSTLKLKLMIVLHSICNLCICSKQRTTITTPFRVIAKIFGQWCHPIFDAIKIREIMKRAFLFSAYTCSSIALSHQMWWTIVYGV